MGHSPETTPSGAEADAMREVAPSAAPSPEPSPLTVDDVLRIAGFTDRTPTREAMIIAHAYHRIALDLAERLGRDAANWFCFAVWSSKAIGESLDLTKDSPFLAELGARLNVPGWFRGHFRSIMLGLLGPTYQLALGLANRSIFLETGSFAASLWRPDSGGTGEGTTCALRVSPPGGQTTVGDVPAGHAAAQASALAAVRTAEPVDADGPGETPSRAGSSAVEAAGGRRPVRLVRRPEFLSELLAPADEEYLDISARMFHQAADTEDPAERAELLLGANIALSAYEQARAQKALELVLYRPIRWMLRVSWRSVLATLTRRPFHRLRLYISPHEDQPFLVRVLEEGWARLYTRYVMSLRTPVSEIRLGKPLVPPSGVDARAVHAPIGNAEVRELAERFAASTADGATSGVANWLSYRERMRFIVSYFRMYLTVPDMFRPPFDPPAADELAAELRLGEVPEPYAEWFEKKVRDHEERASRPGLRGLIVRQFYRSPVTIDPDAAELARLDVTEYAVPRPIRPAAP
ncbi:hypothetical protein AB0K60_00155 [Thermopolyspora sp. NPDC052614]|uniref:hypothetical protein n=1 Tax=Thermopolyspora sp. NPDC052614 TaxID=3155682 RepID=UPI00341E0BCB